MSFGQRYVAINIYNIFKGHFGSGGGGGGGKASKKQTDIPMTNVTILELFRMHAQKEYG